MNNSYKTWYEGHDQAYKKRKASGYTGWDNSDGTVSNISNFLDAFANPHVPKSGLVLELGCGAGDISIALARLGYSLTGIDISETAISWAKDKAETSGLQIDFKTCNVLDISLFADNYFDIVLDSHCFHCIIGDDRQKFLKEARRVLKKDGLFISGTMCGDFDAVNDAENRLIIVQGIATRYIGKPEAIIGEIMTAGFSVYDSKILEKKNNNDCDELFVWAVKFE